MSTGIERADNKRWDVVSLDGHVVIDVLDAPLYWRKPRTARIDGDLFHPSVPDDFIAQVFAVMALAPHHTFQVLTKRPERMRALLSDDDFAFQVEGYASDFAQRPVSFDLPLPNVWLGTSAEDQATFDQRVADLLRTPAAVRWVSLEPLLDAIDPRASYCPVHDFPGGFCANCPHRYGLDWVVVGGESGTGARPFDIQWARNIVRQCRAAGVPVFVKQDFGPRSGLQGRFTDEEWAIKEYPHAS